MTSRCASFCSTGSPASTGAPTLAVVARRRDGGRGARRRAAGRRLGARQPARSRAQSPRPHRSGRRLDRVLPRSAGRATSKPTPSSRASFDCGRPDDHRRGGGRRSGERTARVARAGLRRGRSLLALPRMPCPAGIADPTGARRCSAGARRRHRRRGGRHGAGARGAAVGDSDRIAARTEGRSRPHAAADVRGARRTGRTRRVLAAAAAGRVRAVFVPLRRLQQDLERRGRVNTLLVSSREHRATGDPTASQPALEAIVRRRATLDDLGLTLRAIEAPQTDRVRERRRPDRRPRRRPRPSARRQRRGRRRRTASSPTSPTRSAATIARCRTRSSPRSIRALVPGAGEPSTRSAARRSCSTSGRRAISAPAPAIR